MYSIGGVDSRDMKNREEFIAPDTVRRIRSPRWGTAPLILCVVFVFCAIELKFVSDVDRIHALNKEVGWGWLYELLVVVSMALYARGLFALRGYPSPQSRSTEQDRSTLYFSMAVFFLLLTLLRFSHV